MVKSDWRLTDCTTFLYCCMQCAQQKFQIGFISTWSQTGHLSIINLEWWACLESGELRHTGYPATAKTSDVPFRPFHSKQWRQLLSISTCSPLDFFYTHEEKYSVFSYNYTLCTSIDPSCWQMLIQDGAYCGLHKALSYSFMVTEATAVRPVWRFFLK